MSRSPEMDRETSRAGHRWDPPGPTPELSVVVPVYNEVDNIPTLHDSLTRCLEGLDKTYEIIVIDDGSTDGSRELLGQLVRRDPLLRAVLFRRNCGQTAAMAAGLLFWSGCSG